MILYCSECDDYEIRENERACPICGESEIEMSEDDIVDILNNPPQK